MSWIDLLDLVQSVLDGVMFGATYALIGIGFTLIFGVMHKINLSYAAASVGAAYLSLILVSVAFLPAMMLLLTQAIFAGSLTFVRNNLYLLPAITLFALAQVLLGTGLRGEEKGCEHEGRRAGDGGATGRTRWGREGFPHVVRQVSHPLAVPQWPSVRAGTTGH